MVNRTDDHTTPPTYEAEKVRQGYIVLRTRRQRVLFVSGLIGLVVLAFLLAVWPGLT